MATLADALRQTGYAKDGTLATPTPTESPMTKALADHLASLPQKFNENQAHQMDLLARAYPGNTFKSMMLEGDPQAMSELAMQAPIIGMTAYHGTPHKIKGLFDINKVGTGEGAQAYGHGMYFAESPKVADQYRKDLSAIVNYDQNTKKYQVLDKSRKVLGEYDDMAKAGQEAEKAGNLYKVDIPDEQIPNMLDWDKPLSQQPKSIQTVAKLRLEEIKAMGGNPPADPTGEWLYKALHPQGKESGVGNGPQLAAKRLQEAGVPGIRYLDEFSRSKGKGTSNFVVFEPSTVKILEENAKPVSRKALIEEQVKKLKD